MKDAAFDQVFPSSHRFRSWLYWTPVDIATRAAALLAPTPRHRVLDVGSGVGKLCLVGATTTQATWVGVERDRDMVRVAAAAAAHLHVDHRVRFIHGPITTIDWSQFDSFYFFNPFAELLSSTAGDPLDRRQQYCAAIAFAQQELACASAGARVVTYHGLGGDLPPGFELVHREPAGEDELCLWIHR